MNQGEEFNFKPLLYLTVYPRLRKIAIDNGYTLALHGSVIRDLDLVAIAWTEQAIPPTDLIKLFMDALKDGRIEEDNITYEGQKPFGRITFMIHLGRGALIDISIIRPNTVEADLQVKFNTVMALLEKVQPQLPDNKDVKDILQLYSFKVKDGKNT